MKIRYNIYIDDLIINTLKDLSEHYQPFKPTVSAMIVEAINQYIVKQETNNALNANVERTKRAKTGTETTEV